MPELTVCRYCKQPINKDADDYVLIEKEGEPQEIAHLGCEQTTPSNSLDKAED